MTSPHDDDAWDRAYAQAERRAQGSGQDEPLVSMWNEFIPEDKLPARPWIVPGLLMRGYVTMIIGAPDQGKSLIGVTWATCLAAGHGWGGFRPLAAGTAMICAAEEDRIEQERRFRAAGKAIGVCLEDAAPRLIRFAVKRNTPLFKLDPDSREIVPTETWDALLELIENERPDLLILDPLVEFHSAEENSNVQMKAIVTYVRNVARYHEFAAVIIHHTRKGQHDTGDLDASRGASAIGAAARFAIEAATMTKAEAKRFAVPEGRRRFYLRCDNARAAYAPPAEEAEWWEKVGYDIGPAKDSTPALAPWAAPKAIRPDDATLDRLVDAIAAGWTHPDTGVLQAWSPQVTGQSDRSIRALFAAEGIDPASMGLVLALLIDERGIEPALFRDHRRKAAKGLRTADGRPAITWQGEAGWAWPEAAEAP